MAERSKALAQGASPKGRGCEPHSCHMLMPVLPSDSLAWPPHRCAGCIFLWPLSCPCLAPVCCLDGPALPTLPELELTKNPCPPKRLAHRLLHRGQLHEASRGVEPRSLDSESRVLTVTPRGQLEQPLKCTWAQATMLWWQLIRPTKLKSLCKGAPNSSGPSPASSPRSPG